MRQAPVVEAGVAERKAAARKERKCGKRRADEGVGDGDGDGAWDSVESGWRREEMGSSARRGRERWRKEVAMAERSGRLEARSCLELRSGTVEAG